MLAMFAKMSVHVSTVTSAVMGMARNVLCVNSALFDVLNSFGRNVMDSATRGIVQVRNVLCRSVEDFGSFAEDVYGMTSSCIGAVTQGIAHIFSTVNAASALLVGGVATVGTAILGFGCGVCVAAEYSIWTVIRGVSMLFKAVLLTGHAVIFAIGTIPKAIYMGIALMLNGVLDGVWIIKDALKEVCLMSVRAVITFSRWPYATVTAIRYEFFCGLAIMVLIYYLVRYYYLVNALGIGNDVDVIVDLTVDDDDAVVIEPDVRQEILQADTVCQQTRHRRPSRPPTSPPPSPRILRSANLRDEISQLKQQLSIAQESRLCVVCQDREKCIIILPCRHMCLCQECSEEIRISCPICRRHILDKFQVFS